MPEIQQLPDQNDRDAILTDLASTILVEAGAGTGKTSSMVGRMLALLREGKCRIDQVGCMTFTTKAASEMRERFADTLAVQLSGTLDDDERTRLEDVRDRLAHASIGTIHSFCAQLLRERPVEAGVDPDFDILDEITDDALRREAWRRFVSEMTPDSSRTVMQLGIGVEDVYRAFEQRCNYPEAAFPLELEAPPDEQKTLQNIRAWCAARESDILPGKRNDFIDALRQCVRLIDIAQPDLRTVSAVLSVLDRKHAVQVRVWRDSDTAAAVATDFDALRQEVFAPLRERLYAHRYPLLLALIAGAVRIYDTLRAEAGVLSHQDLLLRTRDMLRGHPAVRRSLQQRFTHLLVDEFQDTDPLQAEILLYLASEDEVAEDWCAMHIRPGALFVVGDPRQSIYRFRRADISIYNRMRRAIVSSSGNILTLTTSFRSLPSICDWVNVVFNGPVFAAEATEVQPAEAALDAVHRDTGDLCGVYGLPVEHRGTRQDADTLRRSEAVCVADWIHRACASGLLISDPEKRTTTRALRPDDILLLVREHADILPIATALEQRGVPVHASGGHALAAHPEVRHLLNALRILIDPENPIPVIAFLRGPFCGADDSALLSYKRAGGQFAFNARALPGTDPRIRAGMQFIKDTVRLVRSNPPGTVIASMIERLALHTAASLGEAGWLQAAAVQTLMEQVQLYSVQGTSIPDIVERLECLFDAGRGPSVPADIPLSGLRIMTLHSAKGLEAPVVILASGRGIKPPGTDIVIDRRTAAPSGILRLRKTGTFRNEVIAQPADWTKREIEELRFLEAEQLRLAYVAATRAASVLIITIPETVGRGRIAPWSMFDTTSMQTLPKLKELPLAKCEHEVSGDVRAVEHHLTQRHSAIGHASYLRQSPSALKSATPMTAAGGGGTDGRAFGSAMHRLLEEDALQELHDPQARAEQLALHEGLPVDTADEMLHILERVRAHALWKRMRNADRRFVELPFAHPVTEEDLPGVMTGVMDLVFRDADGWVIVDYKTDAIGTEDERAQLYAPQITAYCRAWEKITGEPARGRIWFLRSGLIIE